ncbi:YrhK family protein [Dyella sp. A6]|uniref:YrhK family protein n=1 Tax=Dyella aluminiiresistens TaxID=3069105 RepID=UPI002E7795F8|nr:YrhK family protein [Dyella sp. A6]
MPAATPTDQDRPLTFTIGRDEMIIRRRYEVLSILNDLCVGTWFLIGSIMFLSSAWVTFGTWLFIAGSAQLLVRPMIRLAHNIHLKRMPYGGVGL